MATHMHREMDKLLDGILSLADIVQLRLKTSIEAVVDRNPVLAREIIAGDAEIDKMEVDLEEECLKFLALYQPVASDLRVVVSILKMNNDLERIGDISANIAERAVAITELGLEEIPLDLTGMAQKVEEMLARSIQSLMKKDVKAAREVCRLDKEIDRVHAKAYSIISSKIASCPDNSRPYLEVLSISRYLERIADMATNICEDVIYLVEGVIVRHCRF